MSILFLQGDQILQFDDSDLSELFSVELNSADIIGTRVIEERVYSIVEKFQYRDLSTRRRLLLQSLMQDFNDTDTIKIRRRYFLLNKNPFNDYSQYGDFMEEQEIKVNEKTVFKSSWPSLLNVQNWIWSEEHHYIVCLTSRGETMKLVVDPSFFSTYRWERIEILSNITDLLPFHENAVIRTDDGQVYFLSISRRYDTNFWFTEQQLRQFPHRKCQDLIGEIIHLNTINGIVLGSNLIVTSTFLYRMSERFTVTSSQFEILTQVITVRNFSDHYICQTRTRDIYMLKLDNNHVILQLKLQGFIIRR